MTTWLTLIAVLVGGYAAKKWFDDYNVRAAHRKIMRWSNDKAQVKWLSGHEDFTAWLRSLSDAALRDKERLAVEALIGANLPPVGPFNSEPLARLGARLYNSWRFEIEGEIQRRREVSSTTDNTIST